MAHETAGEGASGAGHGERAQLSGGVIASLVGVALLLVFMVQNTGDVTTKFLFWSIVWPLWLYTFVIAVVGALVWFGAGVVRRHRRRVARRAARGT